MIEIVGDSTGLERLAPAWRALARASASGCLFLTWEWLSTWWRHLAADRALQVLVVRSQDDVLGIAPFAVRPPRPARLRPFRAIEFLGTGTVGSDYLDLLLWPGAEGDAVEELARHLGPRGLALELCQARTQGARVRGLAALLASRGWSLSEDHTNVCPFIRLSGHTWSSYLATLGSSHRYNLGRRLRGLGRRGEVRLEPVRTEPDRREALGLLFRLHDARWRERGGSDAFTGPAVRAFHEELSRIALQRGWLRLLVLRVGESPAAVFYGFRYGSVFSFYQSGFDPAWGGHSVGLVLMGLAIRSAIEEGAEEFDLLHGGEAYKYHWARQQREIGRLELHPPHLFGRMAGGSAAVRRLAARLAGRLRPAARVRHAGALSPGAVHGGRGA